MNNFLLLTFINFGKYRKAFEIILPNIEYFNQAYSTILRYVNYFNGIKKPCYLHRAFKYAK